LELTAGPHAPRQRHRRQEAAALRVAVSADFVLPVQRQEVQPMPQRRQRGAVLDRHRRVVERGIERLHRRGADPVAHRLAAADPGLPIVDGGIYDYSPSVQSAVSWARCTTPFHFTSSLLTSAPNCSGVLVSTSAPWSSMRLMISLSASTWFSDLLSWSMIGFGVLAGAKKPYHCCTSTPSMPASFSVGTSGSSAERLGPAIAKARSLPDFTCGSAVNKLGNMNC